MHRWPRGPPFQTTPTSILSCLALSCLLFAEVSCDISCAPAQVLMSNLVALAWNVYMSYKAHH